MVTAYIRSDKMGNGFITHEDQEKNGLAFQVFGELIQVTGEQEQIDGWVSRVSGAVLKEDVFVLEKAQMEKAGVEAQIVRLQADTITQQEKLTDLNVIIEAKV